MLDSQSIQIYGPFCCSPQFRLISDIQISSHIKKLEVIDFSWVTISYE